MLDLTRIPEAVRSEGGLTRRLFLAYGAALTAIPTIAARSEAADRKIAFADNPFTLGVASGDPDATSVVLWTRLAPKPLDGDGGMKPETVAVAWEVAEDDAMKKVVASGTAVATPQLAHSVRAVVAGLKPDRWYWYRFKAGDAVSPVGRTRTLPAADVMPEKLRFAFASCQHFEQGYFTAYEQMVKDDLDLVVHLGDYIYEYPGKDKLVRKHCGPEKAKIKSLDEYRVRHSQYRGDAHLHAMHAKCPWFVTWDDHEFDNNYASDISEKKGVDPIEFLHQRANAYQAYYEMMPLRPRSVPKGPDMTLYRRASYGRLAEFLILDTRQYRTDQPNGDGGKPLNDAALDPHNTLMGAKQRGWLEASLITTTTTWNVIAQQVMMGMVGRPVKDAPPVYSMDQWPGAAYERMKLMEFIATRRVPNPVVLTGDIHSNWVNELRVDDRKADTPVVAAEFVGTSITSGGKGIAVPKGVDELLAANPCVKYHNRERGYVRCEVTDGVWKSDYVAVEDVTKVGSPVVTRKSFVVEAGSPLVKPA
ncbi:alkaline phosphatase D family protein [Limnoglobus roseus]|uniref:Alkaline phosphatase n=1 Tax=Limnoglobus roseus TaxID=2598579 RepID=A0A5C1A739_9BACT|nr:alkaline phosphatase D family protein [Limnoglobus roseus]QEL15011.1 alkaline phosphatase [Limnoglobus roseus]